MSNILGVTVAGGVKLIEEGTYDAVLQAIVQNGVHKREYQGKELKPGNMIKLLFEIPSLKGDDGRIQILGKEMPATMNERANFFKFFKNMGIFTEPTNSELVRVFGTEESVRGILGTAVSVTIAHFEKTDGSKGHYIAGVAKLDPRLPQPEPEAEPFIFTFGAPDLDVFKNKLTKFARQRIMHALNAKDLPKEFHEAYIAEQESAGEDRPQAATAKVSTKEAKGVI